MVTVRFVSYTNKITGIKEDNWEGIRTIADFLDQLKLKFPELLQLIVDGEILPIVDGRTVIIGEEKESEVATTIELVPVIEGG